MNCSQWYAFLGSASADMFGYLELCTGSCIYSLLRLTTFVKGPSKKRDGSIPVTGCRLTILMMSIFSNYEYKYSVQWLHKFCPASNTVQQTALRLRDVPLVECGLNVVDDESVTVQGYTRLGVRLVSAIGWLQSST